MPASQQSSWFQKLLDFFRNLFGIGKKKPAPPTPPTPTPPPDSGRLIVIDPGHGGNDSGAENQVVGINEKTVTLAIAKKLQAILEQRGHHPLLTRDQDVFVELSRRAEIANQAGADIFVSIHCNSATNSSANGIETYHHPTSANGKALATNLQNALMAAFSSHQNRGVKAADFLVLRETQMPACLVETEFISNNQQAQFLKNSANQEKIATAIAEGIAKHFQG
jgi:N-acetylmuramoyl-L-alanine amidase